MKSICRMLALIATLAIAGFNTALAYYPGELVKGDQSASVYIYVNPGYLRPYLDATSFEAYGNSWGNIHVYPQYFVDVVRKGPPIPSVRWGELIRPHDQASVFVVWGGLWPIRNPQTLYDLRGVPTSTYNPWDHVKVIDNSFGFVNYLPWRKTLDSSESSWDRGTPIVNECVWWIWCMRKVPRWSADGRKMGDGKDFFWNAHDRFGPVKAAPGWTGAGWFVASGRPPVPGAIMCFNGTYPGSGGAGHVAFVERVDYAAGKVYVSHTWRSKAGTIVREWFPMWGKTGHMGYIF